MTTLTSPTPIVIKVGGKFFEQLNIADSGSQKLLSAIALLQKQDRMVVLVHGGGDQVQSLMKALNRPSLKHNGLRVTPPQDMPIVTGVLAGDLNKSLVAQMKALAIHAVGISLADGDIADCKQKDTVLGSVGTPIGGDINLLTTLLNAGIVPVIASIGADQHSNLFNVNADHAAIHVAKILNAELYFFSDVPGVLNAEKQLVPILDKMLAKQMIEADVITDGMVVKVQASQEAANRLGKQITIASWDNAKALLIDEQKLGTAVLPTLSNATHS